MAWFIDSDCLRYAPNRYELVLLAAQRARELNAGNEPRIDPDGHGSPVLALQEICAGALDPDEVRERLTESMRRTRSEEPDEPLESFDRLDEAAALAAAERLKIKEARDEATY